MKSLKPDYRKIYQDLILKKKPDQLSMYESFLQKEVWSNLDVFRLNDLLFGTEDREVACFNQQRKSYSESEILEILDYQKKYRLNNTQTAHHFKVSRNSLAKWKKIF